MNRKNLKTVLSLFITVFFTQINYAQTVTIGKQVWMTKNLNVDKFRNGDPIPQVKSIDEWVAAGKNKRPAWCYYDNDPANGEKYNKLYNWYAVNDPRGLAPEGYHVPSDAEWTILEEYLLYSVKPLYLDAGRKMKSTSGWKVSNNGINSSGFSGLPGGNRGNPNGGSFSSVGDFGCWWSTTETYADGAFTRTLSSYSVDVGREDGLKSKGLSVRCLRD